MGLLAGIIEGGLGGGAQALQGMAQNDIAEQQKADLAQQLSDQELAKMKAAAAFNVDQQNALREAQVQRINDAQTGLVNSQLGASANALNAAPHPDFGGVGNDPSATTPTAPDADQAALDARRAALMSDPHTRLAAAESTGDLPIGTLATLTQKGDHDLNYAQIAAGRDSSREQVAATQAAAREAASSTMAAARVQSAAIMAAARAQGTNSEVSTARTMLQDASRTAETNRKLLKDSNDQLMLHPEDPELKKDVIRYTAAIAGAEQDKVDYGAVLRDRLGIPAKKASASDDSAPKPAAPGAAPPPNAGASAPAAVNWNDLK